MWSEIEESATSAGSRAQLGRYRWLVKRLLRWEVGRLVRRFDDGVYYNSDIVQACAYDRALQAKLNRYRPPEAAAAA